MSLGKKLKEARTLGLFTMKQVEEATGISNAYLSQLENDKIKQPATSILYKLAAFYKVDFQLLLSEAGLIEQPTSTGQNSKLLNSIAFYADGLTEEEGKEILEYIKFLKFRNSNG